MITAESAAEKIGQTNFRFLQTTGQASRPDLGRLASGPTADQIRGIFRVHAFVRGTTKIDPKFTWGPEEAFDLTVNAKVDGCIRFASTREGGVGGKVHTEVNAAVGMDLQVLDQTEQGGFALKTIRVNATVGRSLTVVAIGKANFANSWTLELSGTASGQFNFEFDGPKWLEMRVTEETPDERGDRKIVIAGLNRA